MYKFLIITLLSGTICTAQFSEQILIDDTYTLPQKVATGDINNDGTIDVVRVSRFTNNLAWLSNLDGQGTFGPLQVISEFDESSDVAVEDIDNDGDLDVIACARTSNSVYWHENLDGQGTFSAVNIVDTMDDPFSIAVGDLNGDGFVDIVSGTLPDNLYWHKNLGGETFAPKVLIKIGGTNGRALGIGDIDNDGDNDIVTTQTGTTILSWYRNLDGLGTFSDELVIGTASPPYSTTDLKIIDINGDNYSDVIATKGSAQTSILLYLNEAGSFSNELTISTDNIQLTSVTAGDIDNDGDIDVISSSTQDEIIAWYENSEGLFGPKQIIATNVVFPRDVQLVDIDLDTDLDLISVSQNDNKVAWYENFTILGHSSFKVQNITLQPNPVGMSLQINYHSIMVDAVALYDIKGQLLATFNDAIKEIDFSGYQTGIYVIEFIKGKNKLTKKIIKR